MKIELVSKHNITEIFIKLFSEIILVDKDYHLYDHMAPVNNCISILTNIDYNIISTPPLVYDDPVPQNYKESIVLKHNLYRTFNIFYSKGLYKRLKDNIKDKHNVIILNSNMINKNIREDLNIKRVYITNKDNTTDYEYKILINPDTDSNIVNEIKNFIKTHKHEF